MMKKTKIIIVATSCVLVLAIASVTMGLFAKNNLQLPKGEKQLSKKQQEIIMMNYEAVDLSGKAPLKRVINSENPLNLLNYYGNEPLLDLWNSIPDNQKPYTVLLLIPGHTLLGGNENAIKSLEENADICEKNQIPYAIQNTNGEIAVEERLPISYLEERYAKQHKYFYGLNAAELYNSVEWRGEAESNNSQYIIDCIKLCAKYGAYFLWTDTNRNYESGMVLEWLESNEAFYNTFKENSENICVMNKESYGNPSTYSCMQGLWLAGLVGNWGVASDWWHWQVDGDKKSLFGEYDELVDDEWDMILNFPENMYVQSMMLVASSGGTCFKAEAPNFSTSMGGELVGGFSYGISPLFDRFISGENKIPTKNQVLAETKAGVLGKQNYSEFNYNLDESNLYPSTGRFGIIPLFPRNLKYDEKKLLVESGMKLIDSKDNQNVFNEIYPETDSNTYMKRTNNQWYFINNVENARSVKYAKFNPVISMADNVFVEAGEHTSAIITENIDQLSFYISNYRTNKKEMVKTITPKFMKNKDWVEACKEFLPLDEDGNPKGISDSEKRMTTIKIKATLNGGEPKIVWKNNADGSGYQNRPYSYEKSFIDGELVIKLSHNGPVSFDVILDPSEKSLPMVKNETEYPKNQNENSTDNLKELVDSLNVKDKSCYNDYSYIMFNAKYEKAKTIINEKNCSIDEINLCKSELENAYKNLVDITKYTDALKKEQHGEMSNKKEKAFDALLREVTSNQVYVSGRSNNIQYKPKYKEMEFNPEKKIQALEKKYNDFMKA